MRRGSKRYGRLIRLCDQLEDAVEFYGNTGWPARGDVESAIRAVLDQASTRQLLQVAEFVRGLAVRPKRKVQES